MLLASAAAAWAQAPATALLPNATVNQLCTRSLQLMDSGGVAIPDLQRASAPVIENVRGACDQLQLRGGVTPATYALMQNLRAYLELADVVPKPFPFPDAARLQLAELRDNAGRLDTHFRALLESKETQLRQPDRDNLTRYKEANGKLGQADPSRQRVVFFGDSITDIWRLNEYFPERDFINRGIGGQITSQLLGRMKADVLDLKPQAVLILVGTNDLALGVPLLTIEDGYTMLAELASAHGIKVIFGSVLPVSDYHKDVNRAFEMTKVRPPVFIRALNDWLRTYCAQRGHTYVNYFDALADSHGELTADMSDDGLHPNTKGYRVMAPLALEGIAKALAPPAKPAVVEPKTSKRK
jgi:lysophospholipase L1-like esterase